MPPRRYVNLELSLGPTLQDNPYYIWNDVTAFENLPSLLKTSAVTVHSMLPSEFGDSTLCAKPFVTLSRESIHGDMVGLLSIWPTKFVFVREIGRT